MTRVLAAFTGFWPTVRRAPPGLNRLVGEHIKFQIGILAVCGLGGSRRHTVGQRTGAGGRDFGQVLSGEAAGSFPYPEQLEKVLELGV